MVIVWVTAKRAEGLPGPDNAGPRACRACSASLRPATTTFSNSERWPGEVHAFMGENGAGKSTLMKIFAGAYQPDSGEIILDGNVVHFRSPHEARLAGIGIIYQELTVAPNLTVSGNVFLGSELKRFGFMTDTAEMDRKTQEVLNRLGARFNATQRAAHLAVAEQQQVEIARALFYKSRILVMDEPTAALSDRETDRLFEVVRQLRSEGLAIIYISHRMAEVYELADRLSVLRDGEYVGELKRPEFSADKVIEMMVGRKLEDFYEHTKHSAGEVVLEVKNMSDGDRVKNASFQLRQGEVLGLAGLVGAGRTELARLIFGADKRKSGEVYLNGKKLQINKPQDAIRAGMGYVPEDRKLQGVFLQMSCGENITMNILSRCATGGVLNERKLTDRAKIEVKAMRVRTHSLKARSRCLAGRRAGWCADRRDRGLRWVTSVYRDARYLHGHPRSRLSGGGRDHGNQQQNRLCLDRQRVRGPCALAGHHRPVNDCGECVYSAQNGFRGAHLCRRRQSHRCPPNRYSRSVRVDFCLWCERTVLWLGRCHERQPLV
jgi:ribose transport system ATP-binding protein